MLVFLLINDTNTVKRIEENRINRRIKNRQESIASTSSRGLGDSRKFRSSSILSSISSKESQQKKNGVTTATPHEIHQRITGVSPAPAEFAENSADTEEWVASQVKHRLNSATTIGKPSTTISAFTTTKEFDFNIPKRALHTPKLTRVQQEIRLWHAKMNHMLENNVFHHRNLQMTLVSLPTKNKEALFNPANLSMLRYTYHAGIRSDFDRVIKILNYRNPDGLYMLSCMRKISEYSHGIVLTPEELKMAGLGEYHSKTVVGLPELVNEENEDDENESTSWGISQVIRRAAIGDPHTSIRALFQSENFWANVYKDLKYDAYLADPSVNYFGLMPPILNIRVQLVELIDFFTTQINILRCNTEEIDDPAEVAKVSQYSFLYMSDFAYGWFNCMALNHVAVYYAQWRELQRSHGAAVAKDQSKHASGHLVLPLDPFARYADDLANASGPKPRTPIHVHYGLLCKFHHALSENVKFHIMPEERDNRVSNVDTFRVRQDKIKICHIWNAFLKFLLFELLARDTKFTANLNRYQETCSDTNDLLQVSSKTMVNPSSSTIQSLHRNSSYNEGSNSISSQRRSSSDMFHESLDNMSSRSAYNKERSLGKENFEKSSNSSSSHLWKPCDEKHESHSEITSSQHRRSQQNGFFVKKPSNYLGKDLPVHLQPLRNPVTSESQPLHQKMNIKKHGLYRDSIPSTRQSHEVVGNQMFKQNIFDRPSNNNSNLPKNYMQSSATRNSYYMNRKEPLVNLQKSTFVDQDDYSDGQNCYTFGPEQSLSTIKSLRNGTEISSDLLKQLFAKGVPIGKYTQPFPNDYVINQSSPLHGSTLGSTESTPGKSLKNTFVLDQHIQHDNIEISRLETDIFQNIAKTEQYIEPKNSNKCVSPNTSQDSNAQVSHPERAINVRSFRLNGVFFGKVVTQ